MKLLLTGLTISCLLAAANVAASAEHEDILLSTDVKSVGVGVDIYIPKESRPVRGILVHVAHYKLKTTGRWATMCKELKFAHLSAKINLKGSNRPKRLGQGVDEALTTFAKETGLVELAHAPRVGVGMSAGGMCIPALMQHPDKMLTNAVSCSWVSDPKKLGPKNSTIPELYVIGAVPDAFKMLPAIEKHYVPAVKAEYPWALSLQHYCKHDWANSGTLFVPWIRAIAKLRIPDAIEPGKPIELKSVEFDSGWRGDRSTINGQFATVTPAADYQGKAEDVVWLPSRAMAYVWRAWQTKDSPVELTAQTTDGSKRLPAFNPRKSFGMSVPSGHDVILGAKIRDGANVKNVRFFYGDTLIGEANKSGKLHWKSPAERAYAVWVEYQLDGKPAVANPALICVEASQTMPSPKNSTQARRD